MRQGRCTPVRCIRRLCATRQLSDLWDGPRTTHREPFDEEENPEPVDMTRRFWTVCSDRAYSRFDALGVPSRASPCNTCWEARYCYGCKVSWQIPVILCRLASLAAWLALARQSQPEHVHADRPGRGRGLRVQRRRRVGPGSSRLVPMQARRRSRLLRGRRRSSSLLVLLGQVLELRAGARRAAPSRRCSGWRRRPRARAGDGSEEDVPLDAGAGRRSPARPPGREGAGRRRGARGHEFGGRVDGHRRADPGREDPGDQVTGGTVNGTGSFVMRERVGPRRCWPRSCAWSARRSAAARRSSAWPTRSRRGSCRPCRGDRGAHVRRLGSGRARSRGWPTRW